MKGIDLSRWNEVTDYRAASLQADFVLLKAGGSNTGSQYVDSRYRQHAAGFAPYRAEGRPVGSYWMNGAGPIGVDAAYFMAILHEDARDFVVLDLETIDGYTAWSPDAALAWLRQVRDALPGVPLYAYMNSSLARERDWSTLEREGVLLWLANYGANDGARPADPSTGSWSSWAVHQYTDRGFHPGVAGAVDLNYSRHPIGDDMFTQDDRDKLNALAGGSLPTAKGYGFPARDAVQNNLEAIASAINALAKSGGVDAEAVGRAIAEGIKPVVAEAVKGAATGASASDIADEIARRLAE